MAEKQRRERDAAAEEGLLKAHNDEVLQQQQQRQQASYPSSPSHSIPSPREDTFRNTNGRSTLDISMDWPRKWPTSGGNWAGQSTQWAHNWRLNAMSHYHTWSWKRLICVVLGVLSVLVLIIVLAVGAGSGNDNSTPAPTKDHGKSKTDPDHLKQGPKQGPKSVAAAFCTTWSDDDELPTFTAENKRPGPSPLNVTRPHDMKIVGLVFFGRPRNVDILDCYLQQNLAVNGGVLDAVHFIAHTQNASALTWLDGLVSSTPSYKRINVPKHTNYAEIWQMHGSDLNTMYIKIDDDITWFDKDAIPRLVQSRLEYEEPLVIAANLINSPVTAWLHQRMEAVYPYLPEGAPTVRRGAKQTWRPSKLPSFHDELSNAPAGPERVNKWKVPYEGHRWLPLRERASDIWKTPINAADPSNWSPAWKSWAVAAQQHMSLFENIEKDELWRYVLEHNDYMFNTQYRRYNLNFVAIWGADIAANSPFKPDDEEELTQNLLRKLGRPLLIDTRVLVAHFSFFTQALGMAQTDILDRYRAYANEAICAADNQKVPLDRPCQGFA